VTLDVTVLGAAGSFVDPATGAACSGFLLRSESASLLLDCGFGVLVNAYRYIKIERIDGVFLSHIHPDHCADIFNLSGYLRRHQEKRTIYVMCPPDARRHLGALVERWSSSLIWRDVDDGARYTVGDMRLAFHRTNHGPPTYACEVVCGEISVFYTSDTGPGWTPDTFRASPDLLICDAAYLDSQDGPAVHLTAAQAGQLAANMGARKLLLTHLRPGTDHELMKKGATQHFGGPVSIAEPHLQIKLTGR
jgi:ribonuclease BN (tRNA processing enzyme)